MTDTRAAALSAAAAQLDALDADLRSAGVYLENTPVTPIGALSGYLARVVADHAQGAVAPDLATVARSSALVVRDRARDALSRPIWPDVPRSFGRLALFVPRRPSHIRDLGRVQAAARESAAFDVAWLVFRRDQASALSPTIYGPALAPITSLLPGPMARGLVAALARWRRRLASDLWALIARELATHLPAAAAAAEAIRQALDRLEPDLVVVGNAYTTEGALASTLAQARGLPVATIQHGEIGGGRHDLAQARFDLVTVWGEEPRRRLLGMGVPTERIAVTGAPWADALTIAARPEPPPGPRAVLVALSGAGNAVGLDEHLGHVAAVVDAAARGRQHRWTFRLHPKDDPRHWARALAARPAPNVTLAHGPGLPPIEDALDAHDVLVTAVSAAALDAMLRGIPVVALERAPGEPAPAFVAAGATHAVARNRDLLAIIDALAARGPDAGTAARAQAYVASYFGPRDGRAAARCADAFLALVTSRPTRVARAVEPFALQK